MKRQGIEVALRDGRKVELAEVTIDELLNAIRGAGSEESVTALSLGVTQSLLRIAIRKIDGKPVTPTQLVGSLWPFRSRDTFALADVYSRFCLPTERDIAGARAAMLIELRGDLDRYVIQLPGGRSAVLDELPFGQVQAASRAGDREKSPAARDLVIPIEGLKASIRLVDGEAVTREQLAEEWPFSTRETLILTACWREVHLGGEGDELKLPTGEGSTT